MPTASVLLATYNQPEQLALALCGYARQSTHDFEVVIADDGSDERTRAVIERHRDEFPVPLRHIWQEDQGFWKAAAVNRAVLQTDSEYLIFSDGDCIPSRTFVQEHLEARRTGCFVVGGNVRLDREVTERLTVEDVRAGRVDRLGTPWQRADLWLTHVKSLWYIRTGKRRRPRLLGLNFSLDRATFFELNGIDQTFHNVGKEDSDLRNRMLLHGIRPISLWHRARVFHQFHAPFGSRVKSDKKYYMRADLRAEAPQGLREMASQLESEGTVQREP
jgi:glycosyltransferase involved in cell wall biosynthesis